MAYGNDRSNTRVRGMLVGEALMENPLSGGDVGMNDSRMRAQPHRFVGDGSPRSQVGELARHDRYRYA